MTSIHSLFLFARSICNAYARYSALPDIFLEAGLHNFTPLCLYAFMCPHLRFHSQNVVSCLPYLIALAQTERYGIMVVRESLNSIAVPEANSSRFRGGTNLGKNKVRKGKTQKNICQCKPHGVAHVSEHDAERLRHRQENVRVPNFRSTKRSPPR